MIFREMYILVFKISVENFTKEAIAPLNPVGARGPVPTTINQNVDMQPLPSQRRDESDLCPDLVPTKTEDEGSHDFDDDDIKSEGPPPAHEADEQEEEMAIDSQSNATLDDPSMDPLELAPPPPPHERGNLIKENQGAQPVKKSRRNVTTGSYHDCVRFAKAGSPQSTCSHTCNPTCMTTQSSALIGNARLCSFVNSTWKGFTLMAVVTTNCAERKQSISQIFHVEHVTIKTVSPMRFANTASDMKEWRKILLAQLKTVAKVSLYE